MPAMPPTGDLDRIVLSGTTFPASLSDNLPNTRHRETIIRTARSRYLDLAIDDDLQSPHDHALRSSFHDNG